MKLHVWWEVDAHSFFDLDFPVSVCYRPKLCWGPQWWRNLACFQMFYDYWFCWRPIDCLSPVYAVTAANVRLTNAVMPLLLFLLLLLLATFPPQGWEHSPLRNGLGVTAAAACYGTYAREISLLVLLLPWGQQEWRQHYDDSRIANQRAARLANQCLRWWPTYSISIILWLDSIAESDSAYCNECYHSDVPWSVCLPVCHTRAPW